MEKPNKSDLEVEKLQAEIKNLKNPWRSPAVVLPVFLVVLTAAFNFEWIFNEIKIKRQELKLESLTLEEDTKEYQKKKEHFTVLEDSLIRKSNSVKHISDSIENVRMGVQRELESIEGKKDQLKREQTLIDNNKKKIKDERSKLNERQKILEKEDIILSKREAQINIYKDSLRVLNSLLTNRRSELITTEAKLDTSVAKLDTAKARLGTAVVRLDSLSKVGDSLNLNLSQLQLERKFQDLKDDIVLAYAATFPTLRLSLKISRKFREVKILPIDTINVMIDSDIDTLDYLSSKFVLTNHYSSIYANLKIEIGSFKEDVKHKKLKIRRNAGTVLVDIHPKIDKLISLIPTLKIKQEDELSFNDQKPGSGIKFWREGILPAGSSTLKPR